MCWTPGTAKVIFEKEASVYTSQGTLHVSMERDLTFLYTFCEDMATDWENMWEDSKQAKIKSWGTDLVNSLKAEVQEACRELKSWESHAHRREKRQVLALLGGTVFGALVAPAVESLFHVDTGTEELEQVRDKVNELADTCNELIRNLVNNTTTYTRVMTLSHSVGRFTSMVGRYSRAYVHLATAYRLSPPLLHTRDTEELWKQIQNELDTTIPYPPEAAFELPASYHFDRGLFHVILHVPLLGTAFHFHRLHAFPLGTSAHPYYLLPSSGTPLLAVDATATSFFEMGLEDLTSCLQLGHMYVCSDRIVQRDFGDSCLAALFAGLDGAAHLHCVRQDLTRPWALGPAKGGSGWYHLYLNQSLPFTVSCHNGSRTTGVWKAGLSTIFASPSCTVACSAFSVHGNVNRSTSVTIVRDFGYATIGEASETSWGEDVPREVSTLGPGVIHQHVAMTVLAGLLALAVAIIFAILGCVYCKGKQTHQS